jgi:hypothetical protein
MFNYNPSLINKEIIYTKIKFTKVHYLTNEYLIAFLKNSTIISISLKLRVNWEILNPINNLSCISSAIGHIPFL